MLYGPQARFCYQSRNQSSKSFSLRCDLRGLKPAATFPAYRTTPYGFNCSPSWAK